jgi:hypothetical protein
VLVARDRRFERVERWFDGWAAKGSGLDAALLRDELNEACRAWDALADGRLDEAEQLAEALLGKAAGTSPFHGEADLHSAQLLLGHVRLRRGDVESAERHLLAAARLEADPALRTFGPNMSLAQALVLHGRIDAVLDYLDLCSFWKGRHARRSLVRWRDDITHGRVPDFGPNLVYGTGERGYLA